MLDRPGNLARAETLAWAGGGTALFIVLGLPLPFLFGPMTMCLVAALARRPLRGFGQISVGARTILGVAVGASITPAVAAALPAMAASLALVPFYLAVIAVIGLPFFRYLCRYDPVTAWYAAMPGGLQDMIIFGTEAGGNGRALSLIHATRVLIVVTIAPLLMTQAFGAALTNPIGAPATDLPAHELGLMVLAAIAGWKGGERLGLFGASILGPMILSAAFSLGDLIHSRPPEEAILFAQFMIGTGIGVGYAGVTLLELRRDVLAGVAFVVILALVATAFAELAVYLDLARPLEGFLAFAPGGQAEMTILAIVAGADLSFVVMHHLARIFLVITGAPLAARLLGIRK